MNKKNYLWWIVGLVVIILAIYLLMNLTTPTAPGNNLVPTVNQNETPALNEPATGANVNPTANPGTPINTPPETPKKPITAEFMTAAEKKALNIDANTKVQVLQRTEDGKIGAYKIINNDSEILTSF